MADSDEARAELLLRLAALRKELVEIEEQLDLRSEDSPRRNVPPIAESALASLISSYSTDLLSVHTIDGNYVYASPNSVEFLGLAPESLVGRSAYDFFHPDDIANVARNHSGHLENTSDQRVRYRLIPISGSSRARWVETRSRVTSDGKYIVGITRDVHGEMRDHLDQKARAEHFRREAYTDFLTQLPNRRSLEESIDRECSRATRKGYTFSIALFDIDNFKQINDGMGHTEGDRVLQRVGHLLGTRRRAYDTLGRWGGDEFLLLLPETNAEQAMIATERYRDRVAEGGIRCGDEKITISGGIACSKPTTTIDAVLAAADAALYDSKQKGRNRISVREAE